MLKKLSRMHLNEANKKAKKARQGGEKKQNEKKLKRPPGMMKPAN